jgi:hypothetical protein
MDDPGKSAFRRSFYKLGDKNCHTIQPTQPPLYQDFPISGLLIEMRPKPLCLG